jgi:N-acetylglucosaminyldiphosphoundecaprenol N-acetyl-beta-D-mannosaminyltransferase
VKYPNYAEAVKAADLRLVDGMPLVWASRLQGTPLPGRVAGSDLVYSLSRAMAEHGRSVYLLGGEPGTASAAAGELQRQYPELIVAGTDCPAHGFESDDQQMHLLKERLVSAKPDMVFVALGSPKQEFLIQKLMPLLPSTWWIGIGISFSFVCGHVRRAPTWMQRIGLEWIHRLCQEPRRLAKRYLLHGLPFFLRLIASSSWRRLFRDRAACPGIDT